MKFIHLSDETYIFIANDGYHFETTEFNDITQNTLGKFTAIGYPDKELPKCIIEVKDEVVDE